MATKSLPELSLDTQTIERLLDAMAIGDIITFAVLSSAIGRDVQHQARGNLRTARQRLLRQQHKVFGAVLGVGLKRLDDEGKVAAAGVHVRRGRNQFRRARQTATAVDDFAALPNDVKVRHNVIVAQSGALLHMTNPKATRALEGKIDQPASSLKPKDTLELMKATL